MAWFTIILVSFAGCYSEAPVNQDTSLNEFQEGKTFEDCGCGNIYSNCTDTANDIETETDSENDTKFQDVVESTADSLQDMVKEIQEIMSDTVQFDLLKDTTVDTDLNIQETEDVISCQQPPQQGAEKYNADCKGKKGCITVMTNCDCGCTLCNDETCIHFECMTNCSDATENAVIPDINDAKDTNISDAKDVSDTKDVLQQDTFKESVYCEDIYTNYKKIGQECTDDCECETGYCYDEKYMSPFRFCTQECAGVVKGCPNPEGEKIYECLIFGTAHKDSYNLKVLSICMPKCNSVADCKAISDKYNYCPGKSFTEWEDITIGASSCQTSKQ
jgi:hypothetical protein